MNDPNHSNPEFAVKRFAAQSPDAVAWIDAQRTVSYRQLDFLVDCWGSTFRHAAIEPGAAVASLFVDQLLGLSFALGCLRFGHPNLLLQPLQNQHSHVRALDQAHSGHLFADRRIPCGAAVRLHLIETVQTLTEGAAAGPQPSRAAPLEGSALLFLGSGTTGEPRLIGHSEAALFTMIARDLSARRIGPRERHLSLSRLNYFTALRRSMAVLVARGVIAVLEDSEKPQAILSFCQRYRIDHLSMVNVHAQTLLAARSEPTAALPDLKSLIIGSSPISARTRERIRQRLTPNLVIGYGTNEFGEACTLDYARQEPTADDSVGFACPGVQVRIVDPGGQAVATDTVGFVELAADMACADYGQIAKDAGAAAAAGQPSWFRTGDLGRLTGAGELIFAGRADDLMIFNGINIYPREIEAVLESHPAVIEAAALPLPSDTHGDVPVAFVVCAVERPTPNELVAYVGQRLGSRAPKQVFLVPELPKNAAGKVLKRTLRTSLMQTLAERSGPQ